MRFTAIFTRMMLLFCATLVTISALDTVSVTAIKANSFESDPYSGYGEYLFTRTGAQASLTVQFQFTGTATLSRDFTFSSNVHGVSGNLAQVTFPSGVANVSVLVVPIADSDVAITANTTAQTGGDSGSDIFQTPELEEFVILELRPNKDLYILGANLQATVRIVDANVTALATTPDKYTEENLPVTNGAAIVNPGMIRMWFSNSDTRDGGRSVHPPALVSSLWQRAVNANGDLLNWLQIGGPSTQLLPPVPVPVNPPIPDLVPDEIPDNVPLAIVTDVTSVEVPETGVISFRVKLPRAPSRIQPQSEVSYVNDDSDAATPDVAIVRIRNLSGDDDIQLSTDGGYTWSSSDGTFRTNGQWYSADTAATLAFAATEDKDTALTNGQYFYGEYQTVLVRQAPTPYGVTGTIVANPTNNTEWRLGADNGGTGDLVFTASNANPNQTPLGTAHPANNHGTNSLSDANGDGSIDTEDYYSMRDVQSFAVVRLDCPGYLSTSLTEIWEVDSQYDVNNDGAPDAPAVFIHTRSIEVPETSLTSPLPIAPSRAVRVKLASAPSVRRFVTLRVDLQGWDLSDPDNPVCVSADPRVAMEVPTIPGTTTPLRTILVPHPYFDDTANPDHRRAVSMVLNYPLTTHPPALGGEGGVSFLPTSNDKTGTENWGDYWSWAQWAPDAEIYAPPAYSGVAPFPYGIAGVSRNQGNGYYDWYQEVKFEAQNVDQTTGLELDWPTIYPTNPQVVDRVGDTVSRHEDGITIARFYEVHTDELLPSTANQVATGFGIAIQDEWSLSTPRWPANSLAEGANGINGESDKSYLTQLNGAITNATTSITVDNASSLIPGHAVIVDDLNNNGFEDVVITAIAGNILTVTRSTTIAAAHADDTYIYQSNGTYFPNNVNSPVKAAEVAIRVVDTTYTTYDSTLPITTSQPTAEAPFTSYEVYADRYVEMQLDSGAGLLPGDAEIGVDYDVEYKIGGGGYSEGVDGFVNQPFAYRLHHELAGEDPAPPKPILVGGSRNIVDPEGFDTFYIQGGSIVPIEPSNYYRSNSTRRIDINGDGDTDDNVLDLNSDGDFDDPGESEATWFRFTGTDVNAAIVWESFTDYNGNGVYDGVLSEPFTDYNGNSVRDTLIDEPFIDGNGNLTYDPGEAFTDYNSNSARDTNINEPYTDWNGSGTYDATLAEPYVDANGDGNYDASIDPTALTDVNVFVGEGNGDFSFDATDRPLIINGSYNDWNWNPAPISTGRPETPALDRVISTIDGQTLLQRGNEPGGAADTFDAIEMTIGTVTYYGVITGVTSQPDGNSNGYRITVGWVTASEMNHPERPSPPNINPASGNYGDGITDGILSDQYIKTHDYDDMWFAGRTGAHANIRHRNGRWGGSRFFAVQQDIPNLTRLSINRYTLVAQQKATTNTDANGSPVFDTEYVWDTPQTINGWQVDEPRVYPIDGGDVWTVSVGASVGTYYAGDVIRFQGDPQYYRVTGPTPSRRGRTQPTEQGKDRGYENDAFNSFVPSKGAPGPYVNIFPSLRREIRRDEDNDGDGTVESASCVGVSASNDDVAVLSRFRPDGLYDSANNHRDSLIIPGYPPAPVPDYPSGFTADDLKYGDKIEFAIIPVDDTTVEAAEDVRLTIQTSNNNNGYDVLDPQSVTSIIRDNDVVVDVELVSNASEPNQAGYFRILLDRAFPVDVDIKYVLSNNGPGPWAAPNDSKSNFVSNIQVMAQGSGYISTPTVVITDATGVDAVAEAKMVYTRNANGDIIDGYVTAIIITEPGYGYTSPVISFTGGGGGVGASALGVVGNKPWNNTGGDGKDFSIAGFDPVSLIGTIRIPANALSVDIAVSPLSDVRIEGNENLQIRLLDSDDYVLKGGEAGGQNATAASMNITDSRGIISIAAIVNEAVESPNAPTDGVFRVTASDDLGNPIVLTQNMTVTYQVNGTATADVDYGAISGQVVILAGTSSTDIIISPFDDLIIDPSETVVATLTASPGYTLDGQYSQATINIVDDEPQLTVRVIQHASEPNTNGIFRIEYPGVPDGVALNRAIEVTYTVGGTATSAVDYSSLSGTAFIQKDNRFVDVVVAPIEDLISDAGETVDITLQASGLFTLGTTSASATMTIGETTNIQGEVSVGVVEDITYESPSPTPAQFELRLDRDSAATYDEVTVVYGFDGTAQHSIDYAAPLATTTFAGLNSNIEVSTIAAQGDTLVVLRTRMTGSEVLLPAGLSLKIGVHSYASSTGSVTLTNAGATFTLSTPLQSAVAVGDLVTARTTGTFAAYTDITTAAIAGTGPYTITIPATDVPANVRLMDSVGNIYVCNNAAGTGVTSLTADTISTTIAPTGCTFTAGTLWILSSTATLDVTPIDDQLVEIDEYVLITLTSGLRYTINGSAVTATVTIKDNEPTIRVLWKKDAKEPSTIAGSPVLGQVEVSYPGIPAGTALDRDITVPYTLSGTATMSFDYQDLTGSVLIPAGTRSAVIDVTPLYDVVSDPNETVKFAISGGLTYSVSSSDASATVSIIDGTEIQGVVRLHNKDVGVSDTIAVIPQAFKPIDTTYESSYNDSAELALMKGQMLVSLERTRGGALNTRVETVTVPYLVGGTAVAGTDYVALAGTVVFNNQLAVPEQNASAQITLQTDGDIMRLPAGTLVTLADGTVYTLTNNVEITPTATAYDIDEAAIAAVAGDTIATVNKITDQLAVIPMVALDDTEVEVDETVQLTLRSGSNYALDTNGNGGESWISKTATIIDDEPFISIAKQQDSQEPTVSTSAGTNGQFRVYYSYPRVPQGVLPKPLTRDIKIHYDVSGTATNAVDYVTIPGTVTIPANAVEAFIDIEALYDLIIDPNETVVVSLKAPTTAPGSGFGLAAQDLACCDHEHLALGDGIINTEVEFGGAVFTTESLPESSFKAELQALDAAALEKAEASIQKQRIPLADLSTIHVSEAGDLYYACQKYDGPEIPKAMPIANEPKFAEPPKLHSNPGSTNVLYLDIDGHLVTNTQWNTSRGEASYDCRPYDRDGDFSTFSQTEVDEIVVIWQWVSEAYIGFDIDVTTEAPTTWTPTTARALITSITDTNGVTLPSALQAGGIAYLDAFGSFSYDANENTRLGPAFIYVEQTGDKSGAAMTVVHEIGHNMGLNHDGDSGEYYSNHGPDPMTWGPCMGGPYGTNVVQWSKGDYANASNTAEDDLAMIAAKTGGYRPDDHGNDAGSASSPAIDGVQLTATGIIETTDDHDVFVLDSGAGDISLTATPTRMSSGPWGGMLDVLLELRDSNDSVVVSVDPTDETVAILSATVAAGRYYLHVIPAANGDPMAAQPTGWTTYGSLGQYSISGTVPQGSAPPPPSSDSGYGIDPSAFTATVVIEDGSTSQGVVSITVTDSTAAELTFVPATQSDSTGSIALSLDRSADDTRIDLVTVPLSIAGTATMTEDYITIPSQVTFSNEIIIPVHTASEITAAPNQLKMASVRGTMLIPDGATLDVSSFVGASSAVTLTIAGPVTLTETPQLVTIAAGIVPSEIAAENRTIPSRITNQEIILTVTPVDDMIVEGDETVVLQVQSGVNYSVIATSISQRTVTIQDDEPIISIVAVDREAKEPTSATAPVTDLGQFVISYTPRIQALNRDITILYSVSGSATKAIDYTELTGVAQIPAGKTSVDLFITPVFDSLDDINETVVVTLLDSIIQDSANNPQLSNALVVIDNNTDKPPVTTNNDELMRPGDHMGTSVAVHNDWAVVGAPDDDSDTADLDADDCGGVYIYRRSATDNRAWEFYTKLTAGSERHAGDQFGAAVAIADNISGTDTTSYVPTILVGAPGYDQNGLDTGLVFVYAYDLNADDPSTVADETNDADSRTGAWILERQLRDSTLSAGDRFGSAIDLIGDVAIIGAPNAEKVGGDAAQAGMALIFQRNEVTRSWTRKELLRQSTELADGHFGRSVAISRSSSTNFACAVGSELYDAVSLYSINTIGNGWVFTEHAPLPAQDSGINISNGSFGYAVDLSSDGLAVGVPLGDNLRGQRAGSVYVYTRSSVSSSWSLSGHLTSSDGLPSDAFGSAVAITKTTVNSVSIGEVVVGAPNAPGLVTNSGVAYQFIYSAIDTSWIQRRKYEPWVSAGIDRFGYSIAATGGSSERSSVAFIGTPDDDEHGVDAGNVYVKNMNDVPIIVNDDIVQIVPADPKRIQYTVDAILEDSTKVIDLLAIDPDGDPLVWTLVSDITDAELVVDSNSYSSDGDKIGSNEQVSVVFTPAANANSTTHGSDWVFTLRSTDPFGAYDEVEVTIRVTPVDDVPVANDIIFVVDDVVAAKSGTVFGSDPDDPTAGVTFVYSYALVTDVGAGEGTLVFNNDGSFTYTPPVGAVNMTGISFEYTVSVTATDNSVVPPVVSVQTSAKALVTIEVVNTSDAVYGHLLGDKIFLGLSSSGDAQQDKAALSSLGLNVANVKVAEWDEEAATPVWTPVPTTVSNRKGYWVENKNPGPLAIMLIGSPLDSDARVSIPLKAGWNEISIPLVAGNITATNPVTWRSLRVMDANGKISAVGVNDYLWTYNATEDILVPVWDGSAFGVSISPISNASSFTMETNLYPWRGYWFKAAADNTQLIVYEPPSSDEVPAGMAMIPSEKDNKVVILMIGGTVAR